MKPDLYWLRRVPPVTVHLASCVFLSFGLPRHNKVLRGTALLTAAPEKRARDLLRNAGWSHSGQDPGSLWSDWRLWFAIRNIQRGAGDVAQTSAYLLAFFLPGFDSQHPIKLGLIVHACNLSI